MKSGIQLFLALVLSATLSISAATESQAKSASEDGFQWGDIVAGFQMGTALDESNAIIHCRIRNATTNEMDYPSFDFGYFELIHLEISGSTRWTNVGVKLLGRITDYSSAFPYLTQKIGPGQTIPSDMTRYGSHPILTREGYLNGARGDTNEAVLAEQLNKRLAAREKLLWPLCRDDTFALDLPWATWPTNIFEQPSLKVRVSQQFRAHNDAFGDVVDNNSAKEGEGHLPTLYSPEIAVKSSRIQVWENEKIRLFGR